jgi:hypothetical protein
LLLYSILAFFPFVGLTKVGNEKWLLMVVNGIEMVEKVVVTSFMSGFVGNGF